MVESTTLAHLLSSPLPHLENAEGTLQVLEEMQSQYLVLYWMMWVSLIKNIPDKPSSLWKLGTSV